MYIARSHAHSFIKQIRNVELLADETIAASFSSTKGIVPEPTSYGTLLVITSERLLSFTESNNQREALIVPLEDLDGITVKHGYRKNWSLLQGILMIISGLFLYLALSYWVTGQWNGPSVPLINIDLGPLVVLVVIALTLWLGSKFYFGRRRGNIMFQGGNWVVSIPATGPDSESQMYELTNLIFSERSRMLTNRDLCKPIPD
ncbi:MAG: hypothetical protein VX966_05550 [Chloroflexota bacterium]|nr:hypothetical protein [Chloroflexota bacterium]